MTMNASKDRVPLLALHEGTALYAAPEAILKGLLEAEPAVSIVAGPRVDPFEALFALAQDDAVDDLLRKHDLALSPTLSAARAVTLAQHAARSGRNAVALVPHEQLSRCTGPLSRAAGELLKRGGRLCLLLEDHPTHCPESCPKHLAGQLNLPCIEPVDIAQLRDGIETALRLSRAGNCAIGLVVHNRILRAADTIEAHPNRVIESVEAMLARRRRRRRPRFAESGDVLRVLRRLELNRAGSLPSPGERLPVGFITVGPTDTALRHLIGVGQLAGRVPVLQLGAVHPLDDVVISRLLGRCEFVVVLEASPGVIEAGVLEVAEAMRRRGERPGMVWGRLLPPDPEGRQHVMGPDEALHPSVLAGKIAHLMYLIRPSGKAASHLEPDPPRLTVQPPGRGLSLGSAAALAIVRRMAADTDQWLRDRRSPEEEDITPTALAIDGSLPVPAPERIVMVETWNGEQFQQEGIAALRQAARAGAPWIFIVCDIGGADGGDLERLARGVVPAECADRVSIESANLADRARLAERLRESALADRLTVIIVRDGPPPRFDVDSIERSLADIDRLGFEPRQRVIWPADRACEVRQPTDDDFVDQRAEPEKEAVHSELRVDRLPRRGRSRLRFRIRPLTEQVEVVRTRPPARRWRGDPSSSRLALPEIVHGQAGQWRAHLAGFRGRSPGLAATVLATAGRLMGYAVRHEHDPAPIGAGRRAWAQLLFTHPRGGEAPPPLVARVPFGEANLLLGLDAAETLRAIAVDAWLRVAHTQRTYAVVNAGLFSDESDTEQSRAVRQQLDASLREVTQPQPRLVADFAEACRAWFHTDRVVDLALLGAAFQSGLIPVTVDAIETAVAEAEAAGYGRALETFQLGRHLAVDRRMFSRPRDDREADVHRIVRRLVHLRGRHRWRGATHAQRLRRLLESSLAAMPGLSETDAGRQAGRDFVVALSRCCYWGSLEYAQRYAQLITDLYRADRGETGRAMTRHAILPLASVILIRDPLFIASMATSAEQRRRTRQTLNVKRARDDQLLRRYLTRFELIAFHRRYRADVRTSDWPAQLVALARHVVPVRWRGTRRERDLRDYLIELVQRATRRAGDDYESFQNAFLRLHEQALENRLRGMALSEARMLAEPEMTSS